MAVLVRGFSSRFALLSLDNRVILSVNASISSITLNS